MNLDYSRGLMPIGESILAQAVRKVNGMGGKTTLMLEFYNHCYRLNTNQQEFAYYIGRLREKEAISVTPPPRACGKSAFMVDFTKIETRVLSHFEILADIRRAHEELTKRLTKADGELRPLPKSWKT